MGIHAKKLQKYCTIQVSSHPRTKYLHFLMFLVAAGCKISKPQFLQRLLSERCIFIKAGRSLTAM